MMAKLDRHSFDSLSVVGGSNLPAAMDPTSLDDFTSPVGDLDRRLYLLLKLNPDIELNVRLNDLSGMDDSSKQMLIGDIHSLLQVTPMKFPVP